MTMHLGAAPKSFDDHQGEIYREVRRARRYERPLTLVTISPTQQSMTGAINNLVHEVQRASIKKYVDAKLVALLSNELPDCTTVASCDDHFVLLLPEAGKEETAETLDWIMTRVRDELGLQLTAGAAAFPDEEVTFTGLLARARRNMTLSGANGNGQSNGNSQGRSSDHRSSNGRKSGAAFVGVSVEGASSDVPTTSK
jgi:hypothetical protein